MSENNDDETQRSNDRGFILVLAGTVMLGVFAVGLSWFLETPLSAQFALNANDALIGVIAALPLVVFLWWFSNTEIQSLAAFRRSQIEFFSNIGVTFTPLRVVLMAIGAGVSEELLFRGVLQTWLAGFSPLIVAIVASNIVFGLLHMRTALYAFIAGGIGVYLGALYVATGNLLAPIVAHALYDAVALEYTRRAVAELNAARGR